MKALYRMLSWLRRKRGFHPFGVGFAAQLTPRGDEELGAPALEREAQVQVRLSRALGLPEWLPDPCGLALRIPDAYGPEKHQDFLLVTSAAPPGGRHTLLPSRGFCDRLYSTVLPYRVRGETVLFGARALAPRPGPKLGELRAGGIGDLEFELMIAGLTGSWRPVARITLGARLPAEQTEQFEFDPTHTGSGLELVGLLNKLRGPAYSASQEGRAAAYRQVGIPK